MFNLSCTGGGNDGDGVEIDSGYIESYFVLQKLRLWQAIVILKVKIKCSISNWLDGSNN